MKDLIEALRQIPTSWHDSKYKVIADILEMINKRLDEQDLRIRANDAIDLFK